MSEFVFLYRAEQTDAPQPSPEQMQQTMQKWLAWFKELGDKGHMKSPDHAARRGGKVVKGQSKIITDGPYTRGPRTSSISGLHADRSQGLWRTPPNYRSAAPFSKPAAWSKSVQ